MSLFVYISYIIQLISMYWEQAFSKTDLIQLLIWVHWWHDRELIRLHIYWSGFLLEHNFIQVYFMCLNFLALYPIKNPLKLSVRTGKLHFCAFNIFSGHRSSRFFLEDGTVIFKININGHSVTAKSRTGFWCWQPPPTHLPCSSIEWTNSFRKLDTDLQRKCDPLPPGRPEDHDTGLERRTVLDELVGFVFVITAQMRDDYRNKKGRGSNVMSLISRQTPTSLWL